MPYWRLSAIYLVYFGVIGAMMPYWSLYLQSLGFSALQIGVLASIPLFVRLFVPNFWGNIADRTGRRIRLLRVGACGSALAFFSLVFVQNFYLIAAAIALYSFFWNAILAQVETITLQTLKDRVARYGRVRLWGSLGFIIAVLCLGWLFDVISISNLPFIIQLMLLSLIGVVFLLRSNVEKRQASDIHYRDFLSLLATKEVAIFLSSTFLLHASHGAYYVFFSIFAESAGYDRLEIGVFWTIGVIAEIVLFIYMHHLLQKFNLVPLFAFSLLLTGLRWLGIALFIDQPIILIVLQLIHAFSFGVCHAVAIEFCRRRFEDGMLSRGQAFYSSVSFGAGSAFGALVSGFLWDVSAQLTFVVASLMVFIALFFIILFRREFKI